MYYRIPSNNRNLEIFCLIWNKFCLRTFFVPFEIFLFYLEQIIREHFLDHFLTHFSTPSTKNNNNNVYLLVCHVQFPAQGAVRILHLDRRSGNGT